eukprot:4783778-Pyramimonas_sp.AAC.1
MYDYFVVSSGLTKAISKATIDHGSDINTLSWIQAEVPVGPANEPPSAEVVLDCALHGLELVQMRAKRSD